MCVCTGRYISSLIYCTNYGGDIIPILNRPCVYVNVCVCVFVLARGVYIRLRFLFIYFLLFVMRRVMCVLRATRRYSLTGAILY